VSLTGLPLLLLSLLASGGAFALTIWGWRRGGWWRPVTRTVGILACDALVLFTAGLLVNRSLEIFPSWPALFNQHHAAPPPTVVADPSTRLDVWLHSRAVEGTHNGLVFEWRPTGSAAWHLSIAPVVYVPPRYFTATAARFPVVLVVASTKAGPAQGAWDPHKINLLVPRGDAEVNPAVIVFLRTDHPDEALLTHVLPKVLDADLRTAARGWAMISIGPTAAAGFGALAQDPVRFWSAVAVADGLDGLPKELARPHALLAGQATLIIVGSAAPGHHVGSPAPVPSPGSSAPGQSRVEVVARADARLPAALHWVYQLMPAPLVAPVTGPVDPNAPR
jgi:hypothetical protein